MRRHKADHRVDEHLPWQGSHVERGGDGVRDKAAVVKRGKLHQHCTIRMQGLDRAGQLEREPRLAHPADPSKRQQARAAEQRLQVCEFALASDERARLDRQRGQPRAVHGVNGGAVRELRCQLCQLLPPAVHPVVVPVLGQ